MQTDNIILESTDSTPFENNFYQKNLKGKTFRGFWYDQSEKSYGIILDFNFDKERNLCLFAQDIMAGSALIEYRIISKSFAIEQISYDKVLLTLNLFQSDYTSEKRSELRLPEVIEFTLHLLSQNSVYIQFVNHRQFSPPINKLRFGLVLAKEQGR